MQTEKLIIIKTNEQLQELITYLQDKEYIAFDTETTGVDQDAQVIGISVCADVELAYYVVLAYWDKEQSKLISLEYQSIKHLILVLYGKHLIAHNAIFDCQMIYNNYRIDLMPSIHTDTMILGHVLNENRLNGLKELGVSIFGADANKEQKEMKASVIANGGVLTKDKYELYKADADLLAKYGAKDALLTLKLFYHFVEQLYTDNLDTFFYKEESMPLLKGPTYELNTTGLRVDPDKLQELKSKLEVECLEAKAFIHNEIASKIKTKYPGTKPANTFNISSSKQMAWLVYFQMNEDYHLLTEGGKEVCKALGLKLPYTAAARREFIQTLKTNHGRTYQEPMYNHRTKKTSRAKKIGDAWNYIACTKESLSKLSSKHLFIKKFLEYAKNMKLLSTYISGIQERMRYNIIRPSFLQHGTTSGRYSSRNPNFQNLPRDDKRIKACIVSRPDKVFVGADYDQLEPRVFASFSGDPRLQECFSSGQDFYSVIGMEVFDKFDCTAIKDDSANSFPVKYKKLRDTTKLIALASTYGSTAPKIAQISGKPVDECREVIDAYFEKFPKVKQLMLDSHELAKTNGFVDNLFGRRRRMPAALEIDEVYGNTSHDQLPYEVRNVLNLSVNHRIQSTGASIINRASIAFYNKIKELDIKECRIALQIHDELVIECLEADAQDVSAILKHCMENTVVLPGVKLTTTPKIAYNLGDLK